MTIKPTETASSNADSLLEALSKTIPSDFPSLLKKLGITEDEAKRIFANLRSHPAHHHANASSASDQRGQSPAYKLYVDGASRGNPGLSGAGAVIIDPSGAVIKRLKKFLGSATNNTAEYQALLMGLEAAKALHISSLTVHADSELMVKQLNGQYRVKSPGLLPLYDSARVLIKAFNSVSVKHVYREDNGSADDLANEAIDTRPR